MNGRIINLRTRRKQKARDDKRAKGNASAARAGASKAERTATDFETARAARHLDDRKIDGRKTENKTGAQETDARGIQEQSNQRPPENDD